MSRPFDEARYKGLLEGLEVAEISFPIVMTGTETKRFDPEYFNRAALLAERRLQDAPRLGDLVSHGYRVVYETTEAIDREEGIKAGLPFFLQATDISTPFIDAESMVCVQEKDWERYPKGRIQPGELLIEVKGRAEKIAIVPDDFPKKTLVTGTCFKLTTKEPDDRFLLASYLTCKYGQALKERLKTNLLVSYLAKDDLYSLPVPQVSTELRTEIRGVFERCFAGNSQAKQLQHEAEQTLLRALGLENWQPPEPLTYTRRASDAFAAGRLDAEYFSPATGKILEMLTDMGSYSLSEVAQVGTGFPWQSSFFIEDSAQPGEPFVRIRDCKPGALEPENLDKLEPGYANAQGQTKAKKGDLVLGMDGLKWFYASLLTGPCYINQRVAHMRLLEDTDVSPEFLLACLNSLLGQRQLLRVMTIAHTVGHITLDDVRSLRIPKVQMDIHNAVTVGVQSAHAARRQAHALLEAAKRAVEIAIEDGEAAALAYLEPFSQP